MSQIKLALKITKDKYEEFPGLFYFSSQKLLTDKFYFEGNNYYGIKFDGDDIIFSQESQKYLQENKKEVLFRIRKSLKKNCYEIIKPIAKNNLLEKNDDFIKKLDNCLWYVIKSNKSRSYQNNENYTLNENDIIKLGLIKYEVVKIKINKYDENFLNSNNDYDNYNINEINKKAGPIFKIDIKKDQFKMPNEFLRNKYLKSIEYSNENEEEEEENNEDEQCWICLQSSNGDRDNPKINLCKCRNKFVHYKCLKEYLKTKIVIHENYKHTVITYICMKFNCDICLTPYPARFRIKELNKIYNLIDLDLPEEFNYMILESLNYIKKKDNIKKIHVIQLKDDKIYIGRKEINDVFEDNNTVSRIHAVLNYNRDLGEVKLENLSNTYGTFVLVKGNIKMMEKEINLQIGNSIITASVKNE